MAESLEASQIMVEVRPSAGSVGDLGAREVVERLKDRIADVGDGLVRVAEGLQAQLDAEAQRAPSQHWRLDEAEVEIGIDLEAGAGIVIARGKTTAAFKCTLRWRRLHVGE